MITSAISTPSRSAALMLPRRLTSRNFDGSRSKSVVSKYTGLSTSPARYTFGWRVSSSGVTTGRVLLAAPPATSGTPTRDSSVSGMSSPMQAMQNVFGNSSCVVSAGFPAAATRAVRTDRMIRAVGFDDRHRLAARQVTDVAIADEGVEEQFRERLRDLRHLVAAVRPIDRRRIVGRGLGVGDRDHGLARRRAAANHADRFADVLRRRRSGRTRGPPHRREYRAAGARRGQRRARRAGRDRSVRP